MSKNNTLTHKQVYAVCNHVKGNYDRFDGMTPDDVALLVSKETGITVNASNIKSTAKTVDVTWDGLRFKKKRTEEGDIKFLAAILYELVNGELICAEDAITLSKMASS